MVDKTKTKAKGKTTAKKNSTKKSGPVKRTRKTIPSTEFSVHAPNANEIFLAGDFNNWQNDMRRIILGVVDRVLGDDPLGLIKVVPSRVEISFPSGEIAAGYFDPYAMPLIKIITRSHWS